MTSAGMQAMAAHGPLEDAAVGAARAAMALREWSAALVHLSRAMELRLAREPAAHGLPLNGGGDRSLQEETRLDALKLLVGIPLQATIIGSFTQACIDIGIITISTNVCGHTVYM